MKLFKVIFSLLLIPLFLLAQTTDVGKPRKIVNDGSVNAGQNVYWSKDTVYVMDGFVYVESGAVLTIQAGTVVKALETPSTGDIASALIISRGARLYAEGTASEPIIFTSEYDSVALVDYDPNDGVDYVTDRGLWGGVVVLGRGVLNIASEALVEGLPNDPRAFYGGNDDGDNSGVIRYVSIRYTGITVEANKELQGLTLGCVGSGTVVEYVESFNSDDDGFEFFGGTVNLRYLVSAFNSDDSYDYDHGFRGKGQFWFAIQKGDDGNRLGEYDSGDAGSLTATPLAQPVIYNVTYIGSGASSGNTLNDFGLIYKEYGGGEHYNGIFMDFRGQAVKVDSGAGETSYNRLLNGGIKLENNIWFKAPGVTLQDMVGQKFVRNYLAGSNNVVDDPLLSGISRENNNGLDPRPVLGGPAYTVNRKPIPANDPFFKEVNYIGAFGKENWMDKWTALSHNNIIGNIFISIDSKKSLSTIQSYELLQNYPNPFNPETQITFILPRAGKISLAIYNVLGQKVATLADGFYLAGIHRLTWNASNLASGIYFYQLETDSKILTRKIMVMK